MKIEDILVSDRTNNAKASIEKAFKTYFKNREEILKNLDKENLKKELRRIKEYSLENLEELKIKTISSLKAQGIKVYEVKDVKEAKEVLFKLIPKDEIIVKSKSNVMNEIEVEKIFEGRNEIVETDCGDFLVKICNENGIHPVTPALHLSLEKIVEAIEKKFKVKIEKSHQKVISWVKNFLREKILNSKIGLTGANFVTADGSIVILENEGNISLITRLPQKHIIVTGIDRILPSLNDAMPFCKALAIWGTGTNLPTYINIISSPSKTADIEKEIVYGAHGAKEVYL
ncbi:MAG: LUD domain-containing protein, partial [Candidatus Aenigmatarchaeota archaeon]